MKIPLVDLGWQHRQIADELSDILNSIMESTQFVLGPHVSAFENAFASFVGVEHCVGVGSGTDAIELALRASGIGQGQKVIVPANSFIASALGVIRAGADVLLVDCDPDTHLMDMSQVHDLLDESVRGIIPVHLYGQMAPIDFLDDVSEEVIIIEDAAQAQGATRYGRGSGSFGHAAATSFYPGKNLGAYGDAGAVLTNDPIIADKLRKLGNWGSDRKYHHPELGFNSRLDTLQAAVLSLKLSHLPEWNAARIRAASNYDALLCELEQVTTPRVLQGNKHAWHLYVVRVPERDRVLSEMHGAGIGAGIHYPVPMHLQGALADLGYGVGSFPVAESLAREILSLPLYPGITESEQEFVVATLSKALAAS